MKHLKNFKLFEDAQKVAELNAKARDIDSKRNDLKSKAAETAKSARNEDDPLKAELLVLNTQKLSMQAEIAKIDLKINAIKIKQEANK